jgi:hypothetical protein
MMRINGELSTECWRRAQGQSISLKPITACCKHLSVGGGGMLGKKTGRIKAGIGRHSIAMQIIYSNRSPERPHHVP